MLLNLLSNGIKFTAARGQVSIVASINEDGGLRLIVSDTGVGIAEQEIATAKARSSRSHTKSLASNLPCRHAACGFRSPSS